MDFSCSLDAVFSVVGCRSYLTKELCCDLNAQARTSQSESRLMCKLCKLSPRWHLAKASKSQHAEQKGRGRKKKTPSFEKADNGQQMKFRPALTPLFLLLFSNFCVTVAQIKEQLEIPVLASAEIQAKMKGMGDLVGEHKEDRSSQV